MTRHYRSACIRLLCFTVALIGIVAGAAPPQTVWLSSLDLSKALLTDMVQPTIDKTIDGKTLTIISKIAFDQGDIETEPLGETGVVVGHERGPRRCRRTSAGGATDG